MASFTSGTAATSLASASLGQAVPHDLLAITFLIIMAAAVWLLELGRRSGGLQAEGCSRMLRQVVPELLGLLGIAAFAVALLWKGGNMGPVLHTHEDNELWQGIQAEWPLLTTADSLLAVQAMLRLLLTVSAALRVASPLTGLPAAYLLLAAASRVALLALSPKDIYHLEGPLGGAMNAVFEVVALVPLLRLSRGVSLRQVLLLLGSLLVAGWVALNHHLAIAHPEQAYLDAIFSLVQLLEFFGAAAFLTSTVATITEGDGALSFGAPAVLVHCLLPMQQLLPAYFMLTAWGADAAPFQAVPELVGAGRPFEVLQSCGVAQVGFYLLAGVLRLAFSSQETKVTGGHLLELGLVLEV